MSSILKEHQMKKRRMRFRKMAFRVFFFFILVGSGIWASLLLPFFQFKNISVSGNVSISSPDIEQSANTFLARKFFYAFPVRNIFLFNPAALEERILTEFPIIAAVRVSRSFQKEVSISVTERTLWGLYCGVPTDCFYIAEDGVLVAEAPQLTENAMFRIHDKRVGAALRGLGEQAVAGDRMAQIRQAVDFLAGRYDISAREVVLGDGFEGRAELVTGEDWFILFDARTNMERALENMALVLERHIKNRNMLEYVDIRFEGKIFYKK